MDTKSNKMVINKLILTCLVVIIRFCILNGNSNNSIYLNSAIDSTTSNKIIKVALLQINPDSANVKSNLEKGDQYCRQAKSLGADIVLFPEMWSIGYSDFEMPGSVKSSKGNTLSFEDWKAMALDSSSYFIKHFQHLAVELDITIVITYLEKWNGLLRDVASVIDPKGKILMTYAKVHLADFALMEANLKAGDDFFVCDVPVKGDNVRLGIMICYDREFPESARILMLKGAELILTPNACILDEQRINQFQSRAYENAVGVAMTNYAQPFQNGHSCAFDCDGEKILIADETEGVSIIQFDLRKIRSFREKTIWGNAYRRPQKYNLMISPEVDSIFRRHNAMGEEFIRENR